MASRISQTSSERVLGHPLQRDAYAARLATRRAELGEPELPRNAGDNQTPSKRALLKAIEAAGRKW